MKILLDKLEKAVVKYIKNHTKPPIDQFKDIDSMIYKKIRQERDKPLKKSTISGDFIIYFAL